MTSAWDRAKKIADRRTANTDGVVRLQNDGDTVIGAFVGEPAARELHWVYKSYEECLGDGCPRCAAGAKTSFRVMFFFYVPAEGRIKLIEGGRSFFGAVLGVRDKYRFDGWLFEVKRIGKPRDRRATFSILPEKPIDEETAAAIRAEGPVTFESDDGAVADADVNDDAGELADPRNPFVQ